MSTKRIVTIEQRDKPVKFANPIVEKTWQEMKRRNKQIKKEDVIELKK